MADFLIDEGKNKIEGLNKAEINQALESKADAQAVANSFQSVNEALNGKASTQALNQAVQDINTVLNGKANANDVYTKEQTYSKQEIDNNIAEIATPIVSEIVPQIIGDDYYNKEQTDEKIDGINTSLSAIEQTDVVMPINLFNENDPDFEIDKKLATSSGLPVVAANSFTTGFIPVEEGKTYNWTYGQYISTSQVMSRVCVYDSNKNYLSTYTQDAARGFLIPVESGIKYLRFSGNKSHIPPTETNVMFTAGMPDRYYPYHAPYNEYSVKNSALDHDFIMNLGGEINAIYPDWELGDFDSSWRLIDSTTAIRTDYIYVADRLDIIVPSGYQAKIYPVGLSGDRLELYPYIATDKISINAENAKFIRIVFNAITPETIIDANTYGLKLNIKRFGNDESFNAKMTANPNTQTIDPSQVLPQYLSLIAVKEKHETGKIDVTVGYLYRTVLAPYKFYYAQGKPENIKYLCDWDTSLAGTSHNTPIWYCFGITDEGDIICVHRGEIESADRARDYPIVYPHTNYNSPVKVMLTGDLPTSWISNSGDYAESGHFWFGEYIRNVHTHANVWEVTAPYTNAADWNIVKTYERDIDPTDPSSMVLGKIEHIHHVSRDPFSGVLYVTTGDHWTEARIDYLANGSWGILAEGNEEICRQLNFVYTPTYVYWASDAFSVWNPDTQEYEGGAHKFFRATRNENGLIDINNIDKYDIPYFMAAVATYHVVYISNPECILVLDRIDRAFSYAELPFHVWNIKEEKFELSGMAKQAKGNIDQYLGFRCECCQHYPNLFDNKISVGFSLYPNAIDVCGNPCPNINPSQGGNTSDDSVNSNQVNSMTIHVEKNN